MTITAMNFFVSRDDGIRTHDLTVPNGTLYQTEPHPECFSIIAQYFWSCYDRMSL